VVMTPGAELSAAGVPLMALTEPVHSDGAILPGPKCFFLMSLSDLASSDDGKNCEYEDNEETEQSQLSEDDEPGWVIVIISNMVQQRQERFSLKQMTLDELKQPRWGDTHDYFGDSEKMYGSSQLMVPAFVQRQMTNDAAPPAPTIFAELMECLDILPGKLQTPQGTSRRGSSLMRLGSGKPSSHTGKTGLPPSVWPYS